MTRLAKGTVISLIAGFYDVKTDEGVIRTRARGVFRQKSKNQQSVIELKFKSMIKGLVIL